MVKQETARVSINILEISELNGMCELNSDDLYSYYCGQASLRRNGVAIIVNKRVQNAGLGCSLKNSRMISVCFQGKPFSIAVIQVYASTSNAKEAEIELFYEVVKNLPSVQETKEARVQSLGQEHSLEEDMETHSSILESSMDKGAWWATVHSVAESDITKAT